jgi:hypothetical protein
MDVGKRHYNPRYHSEAFRRTIVASLFFTRPVSLRPTATAICLRMDRICTLTQIVSLKFVMGWGKPMLCNVVISRSGPPSPTVFLRLGKQL